MATTTESGSIGNHRARWLAVAATGLTALLTVVSVDAALHRVAPPRPLREVEDAVADYRAGDPTVLVLGSSHARTFIVLGEELKARTGGAERVMPVPVEMGKYTAYDWVLRHRLQPLMDETDADGKRVRPSLSRVILVTEWWDSADPEDILTASNIPARAWQFQDFLADAWENGLTPYNRNYVNYRWVRLTRASAMVQDRGHDGVLNGLKAMLRPPDPAVERAAYERRIEGWQHAVERGVKTQAADAQMRALEGMIDFFQGRGLELTVLLYPRMPGTLTETAKRTTLARFSERMQALSRAKGFRLIDASTDNPITDAEFESDFDHITREGNLKFTAWALDRDLRFLLQPRSAAARADAGGGTP